MQDQDLNSSFNDAHAEGNGSARDRFVTDLQNLSTHAQELLQVTQTVSGDGIAAAREQLQQSLHGAGETLRRLQSEAVDRSRRLAEQADSYVHEKPWPAIAMGMAAGVALGMATSSMARGMSARG